MADGEFDELRDAIGLVDGVAELGDRANHAEVIHLLQRALAQLAERTLATEDENRRVRAPSVCDPRHTIGHTGARGDRRDTDLPGVAARPGIGGVRRGLLVANVDDPDALVEAAVVERHDVPARQCEEHLDAGLLEGARREFATVNRHGFILLVTAQRYANRRSAVSPIGFGREPNDRP